VRSGLPALLGPCVRRIATPGRELFLTFDDGPDPDGTPAVLDLLARYDARATFFVIARAAERHPELLRRIVAAGHGVGNHSLDHTWGAYFGSQRRLRDWIAASETALADRIGRGTVGFRSPAGVRTPPLASALARLELPLVHWSTRFYDTVRAWRPAPALASLARTRPGSIVLLHDRQRPAHLPTFLATLERYLETATAAGFRLAPLDRGLCTRAREAELRPACAGTSPSSIRSPDTRSARPAASEPSS
jgi:peptidoglycan/xylan/chitin deacetylase (PgdA/CDA1 family)